MRISKFPRGVATLLLSAGLAVGILYAMNCGGGAPAGALPQVVKQVLPGQGVTIAQVDFEFDGQSWTDTTWGRVEIEPEALAATTGVRGGYVNIISEVGRATVNLPLAPCALPVYVHYFDLGVAVQEDVTDIELDVMWSRYPIGNAQEYLHVPVTFAVGTRVWDAEGVLGQDPGLPAPALPAPPLTHAVDYIPERGSNTFTRCQGPCNVQAAHCQCFPMSVANCLQWLEIEEKISLPHPHAPGIYDEPTLVGQLDSHAGRLVANRVTCMGVHYLQMVGATFSYLAAHDLDGTLMHRHQGIGWGHNPIHLLPEHDYSIHDSTSYYDGRDVTWDWINFHHAAGCAVLVVYEYEVAVHAVRVRGVGKVESRPWIVFTHDSMQTHIDPTDTQGLEDVFVWAEDLDGDNRLNLGSPDWDVMFAWAHCP